MILLNPSSAGATTDDPTIRRCVGLARRWGCGGLVVVNLYGQRATRPADLWRSADPVGPQNDGHVAAAVRASALLGGPLVAAWGSQARPDRVDQVLARLDLERICVLGLTRSGQPLYVRRDAQLARWDPSAW